MLSIKYLHPSMLSYPLRLSAVHQIPPSINALISLRLSAVHQIPPSINALISTTTGSCPSNTSTVSCPSNISIHQCSHIHYDCQLSIKYLHPSMLSCPLRLSAVHQISPSSNALISTRTVSCPSNTSIHQCSHIHYDWQLSIKYLHPSMLSYPLRLSAVHQIPPSINALISTTTVSCPSNTSIHQCCHIHYDCQLSIKYLHPSMLSCPLRLSAVHQIPPSINAVISTTTVSCPSNTSIHQCSHVHYDCRLSIKYLHPSMLSYPLRLSAVHQIPPSINALISTTTGSCPSNTSIHQCSHIHYDCQLSIKYLHPSMLSYPLRLAAVHQIPPLSAVHQISPSINAVISTRTVSWPSNTSIHQCSHIHYDCQLSIKYLHPSMLSYPLGLSAVHQISPSINALISTRTVSCPSNTSIHQCSHIHYDCQLSIKYLHPSMLSYPLRLSAVHQIPPSINALMSLRLSAVHQIPPLSAVHQIPPSINALISTTTVSCPSNTSIHQCSHVHYDCQLSIKYLHPSMLSYPLRLSAVHQIPPSINALISTTTVSCPSNTSIHQCSHIHYDWQLSIKYLHPSMLSYPLGLSAVHQIPPSINALISTTTVSCPSNTSTVSCPSNISIQQCSHIHYDCRLSIKYLHPSMLSYPLRLSAVHQIPPSINALISTTTVSCPSNTSIHQCSHIHYDWQLSIKYLHPSMLSYPLGLSAVHQIPPSINALMSLRLSAVHQIPPSSNALISTRTVSCPSNTSIQQCSHIHYDCQLSIKYLHPAMLSYPLRLSAVHQISPSINALISTTTVSCPSNISIHQCSHIH